MRSAFALVQEDNNMTTKRNPKRVAKRGMSADRQPGRRSRAASPLASPTIITRRVVIEETIVTHGNASGLVFDGQKLVVNPGLLAAPWGIDVSHHNNEIDWDKVKEAGVEFAFVKATEGATYQDPTFAGHFAAIKKRGILRGAYHFFQPKTSSVSAQVANFCNVFGSARTGDLQPVLDIENEKLYAGISKKAAADLAVAWCDGVRAKLGDKVTPIIYASPGFVDGILGNDTRLKGYPLWIANYTSNPFPRVPQPWNTWDLWQFTETGTCPGITGNVDLNRCNGDRSRLEALLIK